MRQYPTQKDFERMGVVARRLASRVEGYAASARRQQRRERIVEVALERIRVGRNHWREYNRILRMLRFGRAEAQLVGRARGAYPYEVASRPGVCGVLGEGHE